MSPHWQKDARMTRLATFFCLLFFSTDVLAAQSLSAAEASRIDAIFAPFDHDGSPGYAVGVVRSGKLVYARGFGRADLDDNEPITPRTSFHLASLSKQFTAAAVALLILDGKLSLDTPVAEFFPEVKKYRADLRIKHLIYFTSGLPDYMSLPRPVGTPWFSFYYFTTDDAISATLRTGKLKFVPGTQWDYSNVNYMLLAKIVERVSGMTLADFLATRVFAPLGMNASLLDDDSTTVIQNRATGYADRSDEKLREQLRTVGIETRKGVGYMRLPRISPHYGGSGVFSSVEDLAKWDENFYSNRLAGTAFTAQMLHREKFGYDKDNDAFGLVFGKFHDRPMIWFSGGDLDTSTFMARLPGEQLSVICLSNMPTGNAEGKAREILGVLLH
jgi:CubicO group peptidase (beta-lactamase class C family)